MKHTIESVSELSDDELDTLMHFPEKREQFRRTIAEASKLKGDKRKEFERELNSRLSPEIHVDSLNYDLERIKRNNSDIAEVCRS